VKEKPLTILPFPVSAAQKPSLGKRLARLKRHLVKTLTGRPDPVLEAQVQDQAFWTAILTHKKEQECPAQYFRKVAFTLRRAADLKTAEEICARGVRLYQSDLPLAVEHAEIARAAKDQSARMTRWQRVLDLAGDMAPLATFRNLADCHRTRGNFDLAKSIVRRGLELHPGNFSLMEKLSGILANSSSSTKALAALRSIIDSHPDQDLAPIYLQMSSVLADEGLLLRATAAVREGLTSYPDSAGLKNRLAELSYLQETPSELRQTDHGSQQHLESPGQEMLCFSVGHSAFRQHVPAMLGFVQTIAPPDVPRRLPEVDVFAVWGAPSAHNPVIRELAAAEAKPLLCLESGFISSPAIEGKNHPVHSVIGCLGTVYFDTTQPSCLENTLNSNDYFLTDEQRLRAETCIESIVSNRISKFNHAPRIDLRPRFPADGTRRILLVDQKKGGGSIHWSLGGPATFERMMETALARQDHEVLLKLHPEVISGRFESSLLPWLPNPLPLNLTLIDFDVNPFDLFDVVDEVFVCTSQLGFEAVMAGKQVHCFAAPFYAGWGLTQDQIAIPRRKMRRTIAEIFHLFYIVNSRYFVPGQGIANIEDLIACLVISSNTLPPASGQQEEMPAPLPPSRDLSEPLRILIVIPSGRYGASGRYLQYLSISLIQLGCEVMILAEGPCQRLESGVLWLTLEFDGLRLTDTIRREINGFAPHFIYENGVRSRAQRAALEAVALTGARFAMQSEDDDIQIHQQRQSEKAARHLVALDHPRLTTAEIAGFLRNHDWNHSLQIFLNPDFNRWIEPLLRIVCYRMASCHTAIWHPFAERLAREYQVPTLVVPPVASAADFERIPLTPEEREIALQHHGIDPARLVIFIGGALYNYSGEYAVFLDALNLAANKTSGKFALVVTSDRSSLPLERIAGERLGNEITFTDIGVAGDELYMEMLKACDIVCSPGLPDEFNRYRLPSRLVKAMAMAKPVLTCRHGFGESLEHGVNAFLMDGENPAEWADAIALCLNTSNRAQVGLQGQLFARQHFDSHRVAVALKQQFESILAEPPHSFASGVTLTPDAYQEPSVVAIRSKPSIRFSNRYHSPLQFAIRTLALRTCRLDTVVHIGAGECNELEDYCRLGAKQITLVEPSPELAASLRKFESHDGKIAVKQVAVAGESGVRKAHIYKNTRPDSTDQEELYFLEPTAPLVFQTSLQLIRTENVETCTISDICENIHFSGSNDLLVLELRGLEIEALKATPAMLIRKFEWIAIHVSEFTFFENGATPTLLETSLKEFGFDHIPSTKTFCGPQVAVLFRKQTINHLI
jgi:glycosyltransferase involved in cell wall biosynthesis/tetratricopeptide (TPR) repeat protein